MKRIGSLLLAVVMTFSMPVTVSARTYADADGYSTEYRDAINFVADNGYMIGTSDTTFVPEGLMTRAMLVTVLYSMNNVGKKDDEIIPYTGESPFTDVKQGDWFYDAVCWANENGLVAGNGMGQFSPHSYLLKQDAVLILYQYARQHGDVIDVLTEELAESILVKYTDADHISSYALQAVSWAVDRQIFPAESETVLNPKGRLTRAQMALLITQYGLNVEHIVYGRDDYCFTNGDSQFSPADFFLEKEYRIKLVECLEKMFANVPEVGAVYIEEIKAKMHAPDSGMGHCYGMAATTILDKMGKIDLNGNFATDAPTMHDVKLISGSEVENAINYYHMLMYLPDFGEPLETGVITAELLDDIVECCKYEKGLKLFSYTFGSSRIGHVVVVYDMVEADKGIYRLAAYDNRYTEDKTIYITIDTNEVSCTVHAKAGDEQVTNINMISDFSVFDMVDIDGENNAEPVYSAEQFGNGAVTLLTADLSGDFVITNAEGEKLRCESGNLSGDMDVFASNILFNGPEHPAQIMICVKESEEYSYVSLSEKENTSLSVCNAAGYASVDAVHVEAIQIDSANRMLLTGNEMTYRIVYGEEDNETIDEGSKE